MKVAFGSPSGEATAEEKEQVAAAPVAAPAPSGVDAGCPAGETAPFPDGSMTPVKYAAQTGSLVMGDTIPDFKDIILPRINIVQGVGILKDSFQQGAIIFNQSTVLFTPPVINKQTGNVDKAGTAPLSITVLGFRPTRFAEKIAGGARGLLVNTEQLVRENGGTLDYKEWELKKAAGMKLFQPLAEALVAIERPDLVADDDTIFTFPAEGKKYALAIWAMKGSAYTAAAKRVFFTARACGCLKGGYPSYSFSMTTRLENFNGGTNSAWVPVCVPRTKNTPEYLAFVASILQAPEAAATSAPETSAS